MKDSGADVDVALFPCNQFGGLKLSKYVYQRFKRRVSDESVLFHLFYSYFWTCGRRSRAWY
jgi:hypothetical protein